MNHKRPSPARLFRAICVVCFVACTAGGQERASATANIQKQLLGAWTLVSQYTLREDGSRFNAVGSNPKGILIYDESGRMSVQIIEATIPNFAAGNRLEGTPEENRAAVQGTISYFGTYTVDEAAHTITHHVESSMFPNYNGTDQKRTFTLTGDELKLVTAPLAYPGGLAVGYLVWKRAK